jgi:hypothetical protein
MRGMIKVAVPQLMSLRNRRSWPGRAVHGQAISLPNLGIASACKLTSKNRLAATVPLDIKKTLLGHARLLFFETGMLHFEINQRKFPHSKA